MDMGVIPIDDLAVHQIFRLFHLLSRLSLVRFPFRHCLAASVGMQLFLEGTGRMHSSVLPDLPSKHGVEMNFRREGHGDSDNQTELGFQNRSCSANSGGTA
jgi:hypothetical protein